VVRFVQPSDTAIQAYNLQVVQAIRQGNIPVLRTMVQHNPLSLNACNRFGESIIHMACRRGDVNVVQFLLQEAAVHIMVQDDFGRTPVHDACWTSEPNFAVMDVLLRYLPTAEMLLLPDVRGHTPFHYARREHWESWTSYLQERTPQIQILLSQHQVVG
jgi:ankyrin repeat protein